MSDRVAAAVLIALSLGFIWMATNIQASAFNDPLGPKWVPILVGIFLIGACLALLVRPLTTVNWPDGTTWTRLALCLAGFVAYAYLLVPIGFIVATTLAYTLFALLFRGRPIPALIAGVVFSVGSYLLFSVALDLFLPTGRIFQGWF
ncbi:MAG: tripartite tricarboxylate transporter TctB family protein [Trueperaceae bacterium]